MPGRRAKHRTHDGDATVWVRPGQFQPNAAKLLIEQALQLVTPVTDDEGGMLVETGKHALHRRVEKALLVDRLEIRPLDRPEHLGKSAAVACAVTGQPGHDRGNDHHDQHEEVAFWHGGGRGGQGQSAVEAREPAESI